MCLVFVSGCERDQPAGAELSVKFLGERSCSIYEVVMPCAEVSIYLRDTLKIPSSSLIAITTSSSNATFEAMSPIMESLKAAGYEAVIGVVEFEPNEPVRPIAREDAAG